MAFGFGFNASAQEQLPNNGFEQGWGDCVPWTSSGNVSVQGQTPAPWTISQVIGMGGLGATVVGEQVAGHDSESAVSLTNKPNPFMGDQIVPGYVTLGTPWSTSELIYNKDGGSFGGIDFTGRPKAISFWYKRTHATAPADAQYPDTYNAEEPATVVAYLWKGTYTQAAVPGEIGFSAEAIKTVDMVDRDRNILGIATSQGGEITHTEGAELIAKINYSIEGDAEEWTKLEIPFEYLSDATPEKINVIFATSDYFNETVYQGNTLVVDDVQLVYEEQTDADKYPGKLNIDMMGSTIAENADAVVEITYTEEGKCTLVLPDFSLSLDGGEPANLGDIVVPDVAFATEDGVAAYSGHVDGLSLYEGNIVADVDLTGTIDGEGNASFVINVLWNNIPINVTFNGKGKPGPGTAGVAGIEADDASVAAEYYTIQGYRVASADLCPGLYIVRRGDKVSKEIVR